MHDGGDGAYLGYACLIFDARYRGESDDPAIVNAAVLEVADWLTRR